AVVHDHVVRVAHAAGVAVELPVVDIRDGAVGRREDGDALVHGGEVRQGVVDGVVVVAGNVVGVMAAVIIERGADRRVEIDVVDDAPVLIRDAGQGGDEPRPVGGLEGRGGEGQ